MSDRRSFLKLVTTIAGAATAALAAVPALLSFSTPVLRKRGEGAWVKLGETDRFWADEPVKAEFSVTTRDAWVETRGIQTAWVSSEDGEHFTVFDSRCTHLGCLYGYDAEAKVFLCPCHLGQFDPKTGAVLAGPPPRPLDRIESKVEEGDLYIHLGGAA